MYHNFLIFSEFFSLYFLQLKSFYLTDLVTIEYQKEDLTGKVKNCRKVIMIRKVVVKSGQGYNRDKFWKYCI